MSSHYRDYEAAGTLKYLPTMTYGAEITPVKTKRPTSFLKRLRSLGRAGDVPSGLVISAPLESMPTYQRPPRSPASPISPVPFYSPSSISSGSTMSPITPLTPFTPMAAFAPAPDTPDTPFSSCDSPRNSTGSDILKSDKRASGSPLTAYSCHSPSLSVGSESPGRERRVSRKPVPIELYLDELDADLKTPMATHHDQEPDMAFSGLNLSLSDRDHHPKTPLGFPEAVTVTITVAERTSPDGYSSQENLLPTTRRHAVFNPSPSLYSEPSSRWNSPDPAATVAEDAIKTPEISLALWDTPHPLSHSRQSSFGSPSRRDSTAEDGLSDDRSDASSILSAFDREQQEVELESGGALANLIQAYDLCDRPRASFSAASKVSATATTVATSISSRHASPSRRQSVVFSDNSSNHSDFTPRGSCLKHTPIQVPQAWID